MKHLIFIASDHAGFNLKDQILKSLKSNMEVIDLSTDSEESVDYPDLANSLVSKIKSSKDSRGILICGSGVGMAIRANRDKNIRAGLAFNPEIAKLMRAHNNANVLVLPGKFMNIHDAIKCVENFLSTNFDGGRHEIRVNKLS